MVFFPLPINKRVKGSKIGPIISVRYGALK